MSFFFPSLGSGRTVLLFYAALTPCGPKALMEDVSMVKTYETSSYPKRYGCSEVAAVSIRLVTSVG